VSKKLDDLIQTFQFGTPEEQDKVVEMLLEHGVHVSRAITAKFLERDEPERRSVIVHLLEETSIQQENSIDALIQIGSFCIPYIDEVLAESPSPILRKLKTEIEALDQSLNLRAEEAGSTKNYPSLISGDLMLQAAISPTIIGGVVPEVKLIALIEIKIDALKNARQQILLQSREVSWSLTEDLQNVDVHVRRLSAKLLTLLTDERAVDYLIKALTDKDVFVRDQAALALAQFEHTTIIRQFLKSVGSIKQNA
jgi:HEAT repeat protein